MNEPYSYGQKNKTEQEIRLRPNKNTEEISKSGHNLYKRRRLFPKGATVNDTYKDSAIFDARFYETILIHVANTSTNRDLAFKVLACVNPTKWHELTPETTLNEGDDDYFISENKAWAFYKIQCKCLIPQPCSLEVYAGGKA